MAFAADSAISLRVKKRFLILALFDLTQSQRIQEKDVQREGGMNAKKHP